MKRLLPFLFLILASPVMAQVRGSNQSVVSTNATPSGSCTGNLIQIKRVSPLEVYECIGGTWTLVTIGNAATATALASDPTDCGANAFATSIAASGNLTCATPALGTDTSGNYVSSATASQGLLLTGTEGASLGLIDCAANEILQRNAGDTAWECATAGAGTGDVTKVGDCLSGDCYDGTSDGGTTITLYNAGGNTAIVAGSATVDFSVPVTGTSFTGDDPGDGSRGVELTDNTAVCADPASGATSICTIAGEPFMRDTGGTSREILYTAGGDYGDFTCSAGSCTLDSGATQSKHVECFTLYDVDGLATGNWQSVWQAPVAVTVTAISCESSNATDITINLNKDDACDTAAASTTNMESGDLQCGTTMTAGTVVTAGGEDNLADGDCVDLEIVAVTSSTRVNICMEYTFD